MLYQLSHFRPLVPSMIRVAGAEGQNRTDDTRLFRAVLYRLSYLGADVAESRLSLPPRCRIWRSQGYRCGLALATDHRRLLVRRSKSTVAASAAM